VNKDGEAGGRYKILPSPGTTPERADAKAKSPNFLAEELKAL